MRPLVSILIPAYNAQEWIGDTVRSALAQTWPNTEIIIVDDGSCDDTFSRASQFASAKVSVRKQENQGAAAARNHALSCAQGDFIQWLDADDLLAPNKIALQVEAAERFADPRTLLSSEWGSFYYRPNRATFRPSPLWSDLSPVEWLLRKLGQNCFMQTGTWLVSRALTTAAGRWDTRLLSDDDGEYFCRVMLASKEIRFIPGAKTMYRAAGPSSLSYVGRSERKLEALLLSMELHIGYLRSLEESDRVRAACIAYLQNCLPLFSPDRPDLVARAQELAESMGGRLEPVKMSWKYAWLQKTLGLEAAKRAQFSYNRIKCQALRSWDKALFEREKRKRIEVV